MPKFRTFVVFPLCSFGVWLLCGCEGLANQSASLGGDEAGRRGEVRVVVINNTPYRAVMTLGAYDQTDRLTVPDLEQFGADANDDPLDGDATSEFRTLFCARVFSVGSSNLLAFVSENRGDDESINQEALVEGVEFHEVSTGEDADESTLVGRAAGFEALLGVDFPCNALLILHLEPNDGPGEAFRIDFSLIPSESDR